MAHDVALGLVALGSAVIILSAIGAVRVGPDRLDRVHYLTPITSVGAPLVCLGLCVQQGWGLTTGQILLTGALLFATGPVLGAATGRLVATEQGRIKVDPPQ